MLAEIPFKNFKVVDFGRHCVCLHWLCANLTSQFSGCDVMALEFDGRMPTDLDFLGVPVLWADTCLGI